MKQQELAALRALAEETQGWELTAFSPRAVLALIAEVERLRAELAAARNLTMDVRRDNGDIVISVE